MSKRIIIANWKMNPETKEEAHDRAKLISQASDGLSKTEVVLCPPFPFIETVSQFKSFTLGAQDLSSEVEGAFTGEVSAYELLDMGVKVVLVGHSERRARGDSDDIVAKKLLIAIKSSLRPVLCVGESVRDEAGEYFSFIIKQLEGALDKIPKKNLGKLMIAYEPVWAIGAGSTGPATPAQCYEMSVYIRRVLSKMIGTEQAISLSILYGGSVDKKNAQFFLSDGGVQGLLIGRESLTKSFLDLLKQ